MNSGAAHTDIDFFIHQSNQRTTILPNVFTTNRCIHTAINRKFCTIFSMPYEVLEKIFAHAILFQAVKKHNSLSILTRATQY